jgi:hypothetical protein
MRKHLIDWTAIFSVFVFALHGGAWSALVATLIAAAWHCWGYSAGADIGAASKGGGKP